MFARNIESDCENTYRHVDLISNHQNRCMLYQYSKMLLTIKLLKKMIELIYCIMNARTIDYRLTIVTCNMAIANYIY